MDVLLRFDDPDAADHPLFVRFATVAPGVPGRCPDCDDFGYIDQADLAQRFQHQHCRACGYRWAYQFDAEGKVLEVQELAGPTRPGARDAHQVRAFAP